MSTLLKIDVSSRGKLSISRKLSSLFLEQWTKAHADCKVIERDIATTDLPFLEFPWITANITKLSARTEEQKALLIDHIVRSGVTFKMNADGSYEGLLSGKKATVIIASAGEYQPGAPAEGLDTLKPYLREILAYIGVTDVTFIQSGSTWKVDTGSEQADEHVAPLKAQVRLAAGA